MKYFMNYGRAGLDLDLPDHWDVTLIGKTPMPVLPDPAAAIVEALKRPVGSKTLAEEATGRSSACILICDVTRPVPNGLILPAMIRELLQAGLDAQQITVMVATGLHRPNEGVELRDVVGRRLGPRNSQSGQSLCSQRLGPRVPGVDFQRDAHQARPAIRRR